MQPVCWEAENNTKEQIDFIIADEDVISSELAKAIRRVDLFDGRPVAEHGYSYAKRRLISDHCPVVVTLGAE